MTQSTRELAIQNLQANFKELNEDVTCNEHGLIVENHILGFAQACVILKAITPEEFQSISESIKNFRSERNIPEFLKNQQKDAMHVI